jgi:pimeloyl-ACP methyl ester carboxylesterase
LEPEARTDESFTIIMSLFSKSSHFSDKIVTDISSRSMSFFSTSFLSLFQSNNSWWTWPLLIYTAVEINFYIVYKFYLVPRANILTEPQPVRAFGCQDGNDRFMLMRRILDRLERTCAATGEDIFQACAQYISLWFRFEPHKGQDKNHPRPPPMRRVSTIATDSDTSSSAGRSVADDDDDDDDGSDSDGEWEDLVANTTVFSPKNGELMWNDSQRDGCYKTNIFKWALHTLHYDNVNDLISCFFMGRRVEDLSATETVQLKKLFDYLENHFDLKCKPGRNPATTPRLLTLEDVTAWHRPLAVYTGVYVMQLGKSFCLRMLGFRHHVTKQGLEYWYRPATVQENTPNPLLFFHGIAPGGSSIYIPMLLAGVANDGRALFIFENKSISCHPSFDVLTEDETIEGVEEALAKFYPKGDIALMGHSFGSFQLTWMIYSPLRERIRQFALLDPVSIMLSEPDLIVNFEECTPFFKIFLSELWTNFYVRRHFSWYRNELWLDDLPENVDVYVGLAEKDQIINGPKVLREIQIFGAENTTFARQTTTSFWPKAWHGDCVYQPSKWKDIRAFFDKVNRNGSGLQKQKVC